MMIDSCLKRPFFHRSPISEDLKESLAAWHNEEQGVMMIDEYYRKLDV